MPAQTTVSSKDGENKIFHDKTRFKQYISTNPALKNELEVELKPKEFSYTHKDICNR